MTGLNGKCWMGGDLIKKCVSGKNEGQEGTKGWEESDKMMDQGMECQLITGKRGWAIIVGEGIWVAVGEGHRSHVYGLKRAEG